MCTAAVAVVFGTAFAGAAGAQQRPPITGIAHIAVKTDNLEAAFLALTGSSLRDEAADSKDRLRAFAQMWKR